jgi:hypothetical protein
MKLNNWKAEAYVTEQQHMDIEHTLTIARNYVIERSHDGISG